MKALARDARERYQSLDDMHDDLEATACSQAPGPSRERPRRDEPPAAGARRARPPDASEQPCAWLASAMNGRPGNRGDRGPGRLELEKAERCRASPASSRRAARRLAAGDAAGALELAKHALALHAGRSGAQPLLREAEAEALRKRVERELAEIRAASRARPERGPTPESAHGLCRQLLGLDPDDEEIARVAPRSRPPSTRGRSSSFAGSPCRTPPTATRIWP